VANRLVMLGAGPYQIPGILKAQELGLEVIACSYLPDDPGMAIADYAENLDITDKKGILRVVQEYQADGIMTMCSDAGVQTVGYVNDKLGLTGINEEAGEICSNKDLMKEVFKKSKIKNSSFLKVNSLKEAHEGFEQLGGKIVFKPTDCSGSRGVVKVLKKEDIPKAFEESCKHTKKNYIIMEEMISGEEFGSQTLVIDGKVIFNFCHNDFVSSGEITIPIGHSYPFRKDPELEEKALCEITKATKALKITNAQLNCDFILKDDEVYLLEIGARMGGTSLPQLTQNYTGLDWIRIAIDLALGQLSPEKIINQKLFNMPTASTLIFSNTAGIFRRIIMPEWLKNDNTVTHLVVDVKKGDSVRKFKFGPDRIGEIVFAAESLDEVETKVKRFLEEISVEVI